MDFLPFSASGAFSFPSVLVLFLLLHPLLHYLFFTLTVLQQGISAVLSLYL
uniref:Uncharacterized protein n=1 Tax=Anguilla anguilla TaxID=7936 RepID=A0A0E9VPG0_ANGAN